MAADRWVEALLALVVGSAFGAQCNGAVDGRAIYLPVCELKEETYKGTNGKVHEFNGLVQAMEWKTTR